jgi:hypothetical protein
MIVSSLSNSHNNLSLEYYIQNSHFTLVIYIKSWNLTRRYMCDSPTCNRSSTRAPLLPMLHHACGPSCKSQVYLINFPFSSIYFIITISTTNKSFFQSFLNILRLLILPINIVVLCPTPIIIPFFIFGPLLSNCYCLVFEMILTDLSLDF